MFVNIEEIGEQGLELDEPISIELLQDVLARKGEETGFRAVKAARLRASLHRVNQGVLLESGFRVDVGAPCKRCLDDVAAPLKVSFTLNLLPRRVAKYKADGDTAVDNENLESAGSFRLEDADREWFDGKTIDLDPIIREQVLLALPMNLLCSETCRGLCPTCGQNLNEKQCDCEREVVDPRWMALKDIKLN